MVKKKTTAKKSAGTAPSQERRKIDPVLLGIVVFAIAIRLYGISNPLVDFSSWRQVDTASVARNFALNDFNLLHPQLEYDGPGPNYSQLELQVTTLLIALLFKYASVSDLYARVIPLAFFTGAVILLYLLVKRSTDRVTANLAALVFAILPMGIFYGRAVQPEAAMLFFGIASLYAFSLWAERRTPISYAIALALGVLSVLIKLPNIFLLIPILAIAWDAFGKQTLKNRWVWLYVIVTLAATVGYFGYLEWLVTTFGSPYDYHNYTNTGRHTAAFVSNIALKHLIPEFSDGLLQLDATAYLHKFLVDRTLTLIGLVLLMAGLLPIRMRCRGIKELRLFYAWAAAIAVYCFTIAAVIKIDYYFVPVLPVAAFFIARALSLLMRYSSTVLVLFCIVLAMVFQSYKAVAPLYGLDTTSHRFGLELKRELRPGEPVILGRFNPSILYYSEHRGWRSDDLSREEFDYLRSQGAGYYVPIDSAKDRRFRKYLDENFTAHKTASGCVYYDLKEH